MGDVMTDFFTRLAERTLGQAPSVQPMIASIYARDPELGANGLFEIAVEEEYQDRNVTLSTPPSAPTRGHPQLVPTPASTSEESYAMSRVSETPGKMNGEEVVQPHKIPDKFWQTKTEMMGTLPSAPRAGSPPDFLGTQTLNPSPSLQVTGTHTPSSEEARLNMDGKQQIDIHAHNDTTRMTPLAHLPEGVEVVPPANVPTKGTTAGENQPVVRSWTDVQAGMEARSITPLTRSCHPTVERRSHTSPNMRAFLSTPQVVDEAPDVAQTPTVQVTIGRIEVRATSTPTTAAPQVSKQSAPPVMSLDDYLHQRAKGDR